MYRTLGDLICSYDIILILCCTDVVIGFPLGASITVTERINASFNICPQILEGSLERDVSIIATSMDISAIGTELPIIITHVLGREGGREGRTEREAKREGVKKGVHGRLRCL